MRDGSEPGLTTDQQFLLMGKVSALEEALHAVALALPEPAQRTLKDVAHFERDNLQATATTPAPYRAVFRVVRFHVFDRLVTVLSSPPDNDNSG